jgi:hypothetical protein
MQDPNEIWQAEVNGEIYETTFGELTVWIADNSLLESDKVRRGKLRWLEAGKVPPLRDFFNAKAQGIDPPFVQVTVSEGLRPGPSEPEDIEVQNSSAHNLSENRHFENTTEMTPADEPEVFADTFSEAEILPDTDVCNIHPELPSSFVCDACSHAFCRDCPQSFGSKVKICPYCGAMCRDLFEFQAARQKEMQYRQDISGGFGFGDFGRALAYPFKFKSSLFFGGLMFAFFGIGQKAGAMGSIFLVAAALFCFMMANALTFGVLANTIDNFSQGITNRNFMPSFDDFSLWDDVVHPFFLSIAVWIVSFGFFILLVVGMVWYAWNTFAGQMQQVQNTPYTGIEESMETQKQVQGLIEKYKEQNAGRTNLEVGEDGLTEGQRMNLNEEAEFQRINELANNHRQNQLESTFGKMPETQEAEMQGLLMQFIKVAGLFIIFAGLALLWGLFYFPAACTVAGYTRSFVTTLNPLVGLDTIRHLGFDYVKILVMCLLMSLMSGFIGMVLGMIFLPFDMPTFGNLPAQFVGSFATFYFSVAFAVTLGYAIYKNSDKLKLYRG